MNSTQIESWALRVIDCVKSGQPNEDFLAELKREWIDPYKAARQIAGHANAARGENILWLIGVDEKQRLVVGADAVELASWYPAVTSCFNELAPSMIDLNIPVDGVIVVALLFETDRAPFVVKNPDFGQAGVAASLEVPWRENNSTRSARRSDIIRLLAPLELLPEVEILSVKLNAIIAGPDSVGNYYADTLGIFAELYIVPKNGNRLVIPFHRCRVEFEISGLPLLEASWLRLDPPGMVEARIGKTSYSGSLTISSTAQEIIVDGPGKIVLQATADRPHVVTGNDVRASIYLLPAAAERPVVLTKTLSYPKAKLPSS